MVNFYYNLYTGNKINIKTEHISQKLQCQNYLLKVYIASILPNFFEKLAFIHAVESIINWDS